jgi:hypothetical protein
MDIERLRHLYKRPVPILETASLIVIKLRRNAYTYLIEIPIPGLRVFNPEIPEFRKWSGIAITTRGVRSNRS